MKKTLGLGLLTLLAAGMLSSAAFADPPFLNGHAWQRPPAAAWANNSCNNNRSQNMRQANRLRWQAEQRRLAEFRRIEARRQIALDRNRFGNNHPWFRH